METVCFFGSNDFVKIPTIDNFENINIFIRMYIIFISSAATVSFGQSMYSTDESVESVKLVLVLSNPSSTDFTVQVTDEQVTAEGIWTTNKYISVSTMVVIILQEMIMLLGHTSLRFLLGKLVLSLMFL